MPTSYQPRPAPCSGCGDKVLIAERKPKTWAGARSMAGALAGTRRDTSPTFTLEHADPSPDGDVFDAVDEGCRRARVDG